MANITKIQVESGTYNIKDELALKVFESIQDVIDNSENLAVNDIVKTCGYYSADDGGGALYKITSKSSADETNYPGFYVALDSTKTLALIYDDTINIKQLGAKDFLMNNNTLFDIKPMLTSYLNMLQYLRNANNRNFIKLYIPSGVWGCTQFTFNRNFYIIGDNAYTVAKCNKGTYICSMADNQTNIWSVGETIEVSNFTLKNISFTTCTPIISGNDITFEYANIKTITDCCLRLQNATFGYLENIQFYDIIGRALVLNSSWELIFSNLILHNISNLNGYIVSFETIDTSLNPNANISDCKFDFIKCEGLHGSIFEFQQNCGFVHNDIFAIHFEDYRFAPVGDIVLSNYATFNDSTRPNFNEDTADHESIFVFQSGAYVTNNTIHSLSLNNFSYRMLTVNGVQHSFDSIIKFLGDNATVDLNFNSISIWGVNKKGNIILSKGHKIYRNTNIIINNFATNSEFRFNFNVEQFTSIVSHSNLFNTYNSMTNYLNNNACAFYDSLHNNSSSTRGLLYYDEDSKTQNKLVVIPETPSENSSNRTFASGIMTGRYLNICAKIPSGVTKTITVTNASLGVYRTSALEGTGAFKIYQVDVNIPKGSTFDVTISSSDSGNTNSRFDYWFQSGEPTA